MAVGEGQSAGSIFEVDFEVERGGRDSSGVAVAGRGDCFDEADGLSGRGCSLNRSKHRTYI